MLDPKAHAGARIIAADKVAERVEGKPKKPEPAPDRPQLRIDVSWLMLAERKTFLGMLRRVMVPVKERRGLAWMPRRRRPLQTVWAASGPPRSPQMSPQ
jgi:hypothetical protein